MTIFAFGRRYSNQVEKVHLKDKDGEIERDREEASDSQAHFGKALMQSKLGSARILLGAFNDSSSFSSSSWSSSSSLHPFDRSRCIPRDIATVVPLCALLCVLSRLSYLLPRDPEWTGQTDRWPTKEPLRKYLSRAPRHLACTYSNPSPRPFVVRCGRRLSRDIDWIKNNWQNPAQPTRLSRLRAIHGLPIKSGRPWKCSLQHFLKKVIRSNKSVDNSWYEFLIFFITDYKNSYFIEKI